MAPTAVPPVARAVTVRAPAKVNLALAVGPLREDGYHELATVFSAVSLFEDVTVRALGEAPDAVTVEGRQADEVPTDGSNLVLRAVAAMRARYGLSGGVGVHIRKQVPVAGGMAGGSADCAATIVALDELYGLGRPRADLLAVGAGLGADVPFGIVGGTALGRDRGDDLTPLLTSGQLHWAFALSAEGLPTPRVFARSDELRGADVPAPEVGADLLRALRTGDPRAVGASLRNDLEPAALDLQPALAETLAVGREAGALGAVVSGSGPTTAFLARGHEGALDIAVALTASGVAADVVRASGPVHGARIIDRKQD